MEIRPACIADVPDVAALVGRFAGRGEILPRTQQELYQSVREWVVAEEAGQIVGCGGLVILWADMAEIRSLVVEPAYQGMGIGRALVDALMAQAAELEVPQVITLTRKAGFFHKLGFQVVPRETLPRKIWKDCVTCTKFVGCDEVAMVRGVEVAERLEGWMVGKEAGWLADRSPFPKGPRGADGEWLEGWGREREEWKGGRLECGQNGSLKDRQPKNSRRIDPDPRSLIPDP